MCAYINKLKLFTFFGWQTEFVRFTSFCNIFFFFTFLMLFYFWYIICFAYIMALFVVKLSYSVLCVRWDGFYGVADVIYMHIIMILHGNVWKAKRLNKWNRTTIQNFCLYETLGAGCWQTNAFTILDISLLNKS